MHVMQHYVCDAALSFSLLLCVFPLRLTKIDFSSFPLQKEINFMLSYPILEIGRFYELVIQQNAMDSINM